MAIMGGCEEKNRTPILEERVCPRCGETVEVFMISKMTDCTPMITCLAFPESPPARAFLKTLLPPADK